MSFQSASLAVAVSQRSGLYLSELIASETVALRKGTP